METFNNWMVFLNDILWHNMVLYAILATGILFTIWTRFGQALALTHGWRGHAWFGVPLRSPPGPGNGSPRRPAAGSR